MKANSCSLKGLAQVHVFTPSGLLLPALFGKVMGPLGDGVSLHERSAPCRMEFCEFTALSSCNVLSLLPVYGWSASYVYDLSDSGSTKVITGVLLGLFHHLYHLLPVNICFMRFRDAAYAAYVFTIVSS